MTNERELKSAPITISVDASERVNVVRFIFILMVVYIHSWALPKLSYELVVPEWVQIVKDFVSDVICSVAVPGFFIISSYLFNTKEHSWGNDIKRKVRSILVPYLIINTFWLLFFKTMSIIPQTAPAFSSEQYTIESIRDVFEAYFGRHPLYYPFWFLKDLFLINLIAIPIKWLCDRFPVLTAISFLVFWFSGISLPFLTENESLLYWMIGLYAAKAGMDLCSFDAVRGYEWLLACVLAAVLAYFVKCPATRIVYILTAFGTCFAMVPYIKKMRCYNNILGWSKYSFFVYSFHEFYEAILKKILMSIIPQYGPIQMLEFLLLPILIVTSCVWVGGLVNKHMPGVYRLITGGRAG